MAVEKLTCPNCGASVGKHQQKCGYCGSSIRVKHDDDSERGLAVKAEETLNSFMDSIESSKVVDNLPQILGMIFGAIIIIVGIILCGVAVVIFVEGSTIFGLIPLIIGIILLIVGIILCVLVNKALKTKREGYD